MKKLESDNWSGALAWQRDNYDDYDDIIGYKNDKNCNCLLVAQVVLGRETIIMIIVFNCLLFIIVYCL